MRKKNKPLILFQVTTGADHISGTSEDDNSIYTLHTPTVKPTVYSNILYNGPSAEFLKRLKNLRNMEQKFNFTENDNINYFQNENLTNLSINSHYAISNQSKDINTHLTTLNKNKDINTYLTYQNKVPPNGYYQWTPFPSTNNFEEIKLHHKDSSKNEMIFDIRNKNTQKEGNGFFESGQTEDKLNPQAKPTLLPIHLNILKHEHFSKNNFFPEFTNSQSKFGDKIVPEPDVVHSSHISVPIERNKLNIKIENNFGNPLKSQDSIWSKKLPRHSSSRYFTTANLRGTENHSPSDNFNEDVVIMPQRDSFHPFSKLTTAVNEEEFNSFKPISTQIESFTGRQVIMPSSASVAGQAKPKLRQSNPIIGNKVRSKFLQANSNIFNPKLENHKSDATVHSSVHPSQAPSLLVPLPLEPRFSTSFIAYPPLNRNPSQSAVNIDNINGNQRKFSENVLKNKNGLGRKNAQLLNMHKKSQFNIDSSSTMQKNSNNNNLGPSQFDAWVGRASLRDKQNLPTGILFGSGVSKSATKDMNSQTKIHSQFPSIIHMTTSVPVLLHDSNVTASYHRSPFFTNLQKLNPPNNEPYLHGENRIRNFSFEFPKLSKPTTKFPIIKDIQQIGRFQSENRHENPNVQISMPLKITRPHSNNEKFRSQFENKNVVTTSRIQDTSHLIQNNERGSHNGQSSQTQSNNFILNNNQGMVWNQPAPKQNVNDQYPITNTRHHPVTQMPQLSPFDSFLSNPLKFKANNNPVRVLNNRPTLINSEILEEPQTTISKTKNSFSHLVHKPSLTFLNDGFINFDHIPSLSPDLIEVIKLPSLSVQPGNNLNLIPQSREIIQIDSQHHRSSIGDQYISTTTKPPTDFTIKFSQPVNTNDPTRIDTSFNNKYKHSYYKNTYRLRPRYSVPLGLQYMKYNPMFGNPPKPTFYKNYSPKYIPKKRPTKIDLEYEGIPEIVQNSANKSSGVMIKIPRANNGGVLLRDKKIVELGMTKDDSSFTYENVQAIVNPVTNVVISFKRTADNLRMLDKIGKKINDTREHKSNSRRKVSKTNQKSRTSELDNAFQTKRPTPSPFEFRNSEDHPEGVSDAIYDALYELVHQSKSKTDFEMSLEKLMTSSKMNDSRSIADLIKSFETNDTSFESLVDKNKMLNFIPGFSTRLEKQFSDNNESVVYNADLSRNYNEYGSEFINDYLMYDIDQRQFAAANNLDSHKLKNKLSNPSNYSLGKYYIPSISHSIELPNTYMKLYESQSLYFNDSIHNQHFSTIDKNIDKIPNDGQIYFIGNSKIGVRKMPPNKDDLVHNDSDLHVSDQHDLFPFTDYTKISSTDEDDTGTESLHVSDKSHTNSESKHSSNELTFEETSNDKISETSYEEIFENPEIIPDSINNTKEHKSYINSHTNSWTSFDNLDDIPSTFKPLVKASDSIVSLKESANLDDGYPQNLFASLTDELRLSGIGKQVDADESSELECNDKCHSDMSGDNSRADNDHINFNSFDNTGLFFDARAENPINLEKFNLESSERSKIFMSSDISDEERPDEMKFIDHIELGTAVSAPGGDLNKDMSQEMDEVSLYSISKDETEEDPKISRISKIISSKMSDDTLYRDEVEEQNQETGDDVQEELLISPYKHYTSKLIVPYSEKIHIPTQDSIALVESSPWHSEHSMLRTNNIFSLGDYDYGGNGIYPYSNPSVRHSLYFAEPQEHGYPEVTSNSKVPQFFPNGVNLNYFRNFHQYPEGKNLFYSAYGAYPTINSNLPGPQLKYFSD